MYPNKMYLNLFYFNFPFSVVLPKCLDHQFRCNNGKCIPSKYVCDGELDCEDKSDEDPTSCPFSGELSIHKKSLHFADAAERFNVIRKYT